MIYKNRELKCGNVLKIVDYFQSNQALLNQNTQLLLFCLKQYNLILFHLLKCNYFAVLSSLSESVADLLLLAVTPTVNSDVQ